MRWCGQEGRCAASLPASSAVFLPQSAHAMGHIPRLRSHVRHFNASKQNNGSHTQSRRGPQHHRNCHVSTLRHGTATAAAPLLLHHHRTTASVSALTWRGLLRVREAAEAVRMAIHQHRDRVAALARCWGGLTDYLQAGQEAGAVLQQADLGLADVWQ
jgi:hypothetical protein